MSTALKFAFDHIRRAPFQALSAIFVLFLTFFVGTTVAILVYSSGTVLKYFETRPQIIAFLKEDVTPEEISALQNELVVDGRVKEVRYVPKEEALAIYKTATQNNPLLGELVSPSIFPASLEFTLTDLNLAEELINEIKGKEIVDEVGFTATLGGENTLNDVVGRLKTITFYVRVGGVVFVSILALTSFLVLLVIVGMRISTRKGEIEILKLIGATPGFIRSPIILEALIYATLGVLTGWLLSFILWLYASPSVATYFGSIPVLPKTTSELVVFFLIILGVELFLGILLALMGSMLAISRAAKNR